jgi:hypothetical protein
MKTTVLVGLVWLAAVHASAQTLKIPVFVEASVSENDAVGRAVVFEIREAVGRSSIFQRVEGFKYRKPHDEGDIVPVIRLILPSLPTADGSGTAIAQTIVYDAPAMPVGGLFIATSVHTCGSTKVVECARSILSDLDREMTNLKKDHEDWWNRLVVR